MNCNSSFFNYWDSIRLVNNGHDMKRKAVYKDIRSVESTDIALAVLRIGYGVNCNSYLRSDGTFSKSKTIPSAGGIYPIEVFVFIKRRSELFDVFTYNVENSSLKYDTTLSVINDPLYFDLYKYDILLLFCADPAKSIDKYGDRGYYYSLIDTAHAAINTLTYATSLDAECVLITKFSKYDLAKDLNFMERGIEPLAFVAFSTENEKSDAEPLISRGIYTESSCVDYQNNLIKNALVELMFQQEDGRTQVGRFFSVKDIFSLLNNGCKNSSHSTFQGALSRSNSNVGYQLLNSRNIRYSIVNRHSSKFFSFSILSIDLLLGVLNTKTVPFNIDFPTTQSNSVSMRLILRRCDIPDGVYEYSSLDERLECVTKDIGDFTFVDACMNQEWVANANAIFILYSQNVESSTSKAMFLESLLNSVFIGNFLYLASSVFKVGISCIGAFDQKILKSMAKLNSGDEEILYVAVVGSDFESGFKIDKESIACNH